MTILNAFPVRPSSRAARRAGAWLAVVAAIAGTGAAAFTVVEWRARRDLDRLLGPPIMPPADDGARYSPPPPSAPGPSR